MSRADDWKDALDEVNATRAARGLPAFQRDDGLSVAAGRCAVARAVRLVAGHLNDFTFLPPGANAHAAGCAAWEPRMGWGACCTYERWTHAGAAWAYGADGKRYMSLFVVNRSGAASAVVACPSGACPTKVPQTQANASAGACAGGVGGSADDMLFPRAQALAYRLVVRVRHPFGGRFGCR